MLNTLKRGIGLAVCPDALIQSDLDAGDLVRLFWEPAPKETTMFMLRHADKWCSPMLSRFIEIVENVIANDG